MTRAEWDLEVAVYLAGAFSGTPFDRVAETAYRLDLGAYEAADVLEAVRDAAMVAKDANFRPSAPAVRRLLERRGALMPDARWSDVRRAVLGAYNVAAAALPSYLEWVLVRMPTALAWLRQTGAQVVVAAARENREELYLPFVDMLRRRGSATLEIAA